MPIFGNAFDSKMQSSEMEMINHYQFDTDLNVKKTHRKDEKTQTKGIVLGVMIDHKLTWKHHIIHWSEKCREESLIAIEPGNFSTSSQFS